MLLGFSNYRLLLALESQQRKIITDHERRIHKDMLPSRWKVEKFAKIIGDLRKAIGFVSALNLIVNNTSISLHVYPPRFHTKCLLAGRKSSIVSSLAHSIPIIFFADLCHLSYSI